ncbi:MAG: FtsX-like permease family protein [Solirubrobacteraceae bacterium]|nr:FtsX-like permease family protein [Solirubrobacteraceae bacterium]
MRTLLLRSLRARAGRTLKTSLAVVLGVALIAGTLIFTDTINRTFDEIGETSYRGVAVVVTPALPPGTPDSDSDDDGRALPRTLAQRVADAPLVRDARGQIEGTALVFERDGRTRIGGQGPPSILLSTLPDGYGAISYTSGRPPTGGDEVAFDADTAEKAEARVGDTVHVQGEGPRRAMRLVGIVQLGDGSTSFGGATLTFAAPETAAELAGRSDDRYYSEILAIGQEGASDDEVAASVRAAVGDAGTVRTGQAQGDQQAQDIKDAIAFLPTMLLVFAGIATFVGSFLIFNTFSITMAQRQREFALLRALGADRRQVRVMVTGEALTVGIIGAVLGMAGGFVVAPGIRALLEGFGADMPSTATVFAGRTIVVSLVVGLLVTLVASWAPARRATRVAPIEALRDAAAPPGRGAVRRGPVVVGAIAGTLGAVAVLLAVVAGASTGVAGIGAGLLVLGAILVSPALVGPLAASLSRPLRSLFGLPGRLAGDNAARQPGRTAVTSGALMIGLALVVFATVFAAGLKDTLRGDIERVTGAPVVIQEADGGFSGLSRSLVDAVARVPGVDAAGGVGFGRVAVDGHGNAPVTVIDGRALEEGLARLEPVDGSDAAPGDPGDGRAHVTEGTADDLDLRSGSTVEVTGVNGERRTLTVVTLVEGTASAVTGIVLNERTAAELGIRDPYFVLVDGDRDAIARAVATDYPAAEVLSRDDWISDQVGQVDQLLGLVYALLALSIVVALFGIVNTLGLSIQERTRELGLLRAVGATRRQVRRMIALEAVITALLGALLGAVLGFVLAAAVGTTLDGFAVSVPIGQIVVLVVITTLLGVLASLRPARRAANVDVLVAIGEE